MADSNLGLSGRPHSTAWGPGVNSGEARDFEVRGLWKGRTWEYKDRGPGGLKSPAGGSGGRSPRS